MDTAYFLQQLINGVTLGSVYGLIAIGYTMVYGIIGMINFAHGDIFMVGAFIALISFILFALTSIALPIVLLLTLLIAMVFTACYGWTVEKLAYKPLRKSFRLAPLISALGMSIVLQNYVQAAQGARIKTLQPVIQGGFTFMEDTGFTVSLSYLQIFIVLVTIVLMAIYVAFVRPGGLDATWAFFNLVFIINVSILAVNFYTLKIDKTGLTKKTRNDGIYAPIVLVIISAILCYGLADKIYV